MKYIKTGLCVIILLFICMGMVSAQTFTVIKATRQPWAGGVAGHFGINYFIELETSSHESVPDTVWINGNAYPIDAFSPKGQYMKSIDSLTHKVKYSILLSEQHNNARMRGYQKQDTTGEKPKHVRSFEGAALISYMHKKKQRFFTVKSFTELKPLNYP